MMKAKNFNHHQNKLMRIITMPIRALAKARDFYVKSMNNYADKVCYGAGSYSYSDPLPRSFSTSSVRSSNNHDDDLRELIRAASTSTLGNRIDLRSATSLQQQQQQQQQGKVGVAGFKGVPRSASVSMAKIEEDKPCDYFGDAVCNNSCGQAPMNSKEKLRLFPRSRSYAVGATKRNATTASVL